MKLQMLCGAVLLWSASVLPAPASELSAVLEACRQYRYREVVQQLEALPASLQSAATWRYRGIALGKIARWEDANAALERAAELAPTDVEVLIDLANAQGQLALTAGPLGKFSGARKARASLEKAVELAPNHVDARNSLFGFYLNVPALAGGGRDKAVAQLAAIEQLDPVSGKLARAELAYSDKDYTRAFALYREVQQSHPEEYRAFYGFGRIAALSGRELDAGLVSLRRCLELTSPLRLPGTPGVHLRIGDILRQKGDRDGARAAYRQSLSVLPDYTFARTALADLDRG
jgi:tetratricopeptide (TPR) repeat protein